MQFESEQSAILQAGTTFVAAKESALNLLALYDEAEVSLSSQCSLAQLIHESIALADSWIAGEVITDQQREQIIRGQHLNKIATVALPLAGIRKKKQHLLDLKRGSLDPSDRKRSPAKDKLWELELWAALNDRGIPAELEEPDIVARTPSGSIAIACKRIYSAQNAASSMSYGIKQLDRTGLTGVLAVTIEDLAVPSGMHLVAPNIEAASNMLNWLNRRFLSLHHRDLSDYLSKGRASCVMASICAPVQLEDEGIVECREMQFWAHPNLAEVKRRHIDEFEAALFDGSTTPEDKSRWTHRG
ncbi:hypothetical protein [Lysobacter capsici]|uniref:hypothetical protein n=1 Tax=Lysobacter capsici TaxID=435897 RepID=UPI00287B8286|nr:hypothetical protein [Lysobacter capsici]WND80366.1 hypothetical protein RJ610_24345 [Lysobacter capsici]WND85563.1 hypothetical protein RJ609_24365 [Lysobacter capsici]